MYGKCTVRHKSTTAPPWIAPDAFFRAQGLQWGQLTSTASFWNPLNSPVELAPLVESLGCVCCSMILGKPNEFQLLRAGCGAR